MNNVTEINKFLAWCREHNARLPFGTISYWVDAYERDDGFNKFGRRV